MHIGAKMLVVCLPCRTGYDGIEVYLPKEGRVDFVYYAAETARIVTDFIDTLINTANVLTQEDGTDPVGVEDEMA
jgi:hypothetical protein